MKRRKNLALSLADSHDLDLGVPYSPLGIYHPPKLPTLTGYFRVADLAITHTFGPTGQLKWYASKPTTEQCYERI